VPGLNWLRERVLDENAVNHLLDILKEEVVCRDSNGPGPGAALTERSSDFVPTRQGRGGIEDGSLASRFPLQEVGGPDASVNRLALVVTTLMVEVIMLCPKCRKAAETTRSLAAMMPKPKLMPKTRLR
jgi:hypothetical protein